MRSGYEESPFNPVPAVVWLLALPMIASEALFGLARLGFLNSGMGGSGAALAMRQIAVEKSAFAPEMLTRIWAGSSVQPDQLLRLLTYPFIHTSLTEALFVIVFTLALGNMIASQFRPVAVIVLFFGSAIGGALIYTLISGFFPQTRFQPLMGGYPAVYGLVGAFTFLLWMRLGQENAPRMRAFSLIGMLLLFQLVFGLIFQDGNLSWIAEVSGFATGFLLSFLLVPGGIQHLMRQLRQR